MGDLLGGPLQKPLTGSYMPPTARAALERLENAELFNLHITLRRVRPPNLNPLSSTPALKSSSPVRHMARITINHILPY